jgi:PIN domain nuclease of toxin-antitoxin system
VDRAGAGEEIIIAKAGRPVVRLVPLAAKSFTRRPGRWARRVKIASDFDAWEIAIKASPGKLKLPKSADIAADGFVVLGIALEHTRALAAIPWRHRDPFDRLLMAQATIEGLTIVSADPWFGRYDVSRLDAR